MGLASTAIHLPTWAQRFAAPQADVRPFITDDARVVGYRLAQAESWVRVDKESGQHWGLVAYGPNKNLELTAGGVHGYLRNADGKNQYTYALPLLQAKYLFRPYQPNKAPGVALVMGSFLPVGKGGFKPPGYGTFAFTTINQSVGKNDQYLFHVNLGANYLQVAGENRTIATWGIGTQIRAIKGWHFVGELFSGDPYIPGTGTAYQLGYRYFFSDLLQVDMTAGKGIAGDVIMPFWYTAGVRIVTERFLLGSKKQRQQKQQQAQHF